MDMSSFLSLFSIASILNELRLYLCDVHFSSCYPVLIVQGSHGLVDLNITNEL